MRYNDTAVPATKQRMRYNRFLQQRQRCKTPEAQQFVNALLVLDRYKNKGPHGETVKTKQLLQSCSYLLRAKEQGR
jgi:hypothetical protein